MGKIRDGGVAWGTLKAFFKERLPERLDGRDDLAYRPPKPPFVIIASASKSTMKAASSASSASSSDGVCGHPFAFTT